MNRCAAILAGSAIALCLGSQSVHANEFKVVGPGGGGAMFHPTISPHDVSEVLVNSDMNGAYITHDGGRTWRMFNLRGEVRFFVFDPLQPRVVYAATNALWRSTDDGESWNLLWPKPTTVVGVRMNKDEANETTLADPNPLGEIVALAIDPANSHILTAAAVEDGVAALYISENEGLDWQKVTDLSQAPLSQVGSHSDWVRKIWIDPHSAVGDRDLYIAGKESVMVRHQGNWETRPIPPGIVFIDVTAGFSSPHGVRLYATSDSGIFVSNDGAATWTAAQFPGNGTKFRVIATSLDHPETAYVSYKHLLLGGRSWLGIAKTIDGGVTWDPVWKDEYRIEPNVPEARNIHDAWLAGLGTEWGDNPLGLGVAEQDPNLAYSTDYGRTMRTTDGGANWYAAYSRKVPGGGWTTTGLDVTNTYDYLFDPFDAHRRFITTTDIGLFRSEDDGRSWTQSLTGVPEAWTLTTYSATFDPDVRDKMWAVMSGAHDMPRSRTWRNIDTSTFRGGVCVSLDGGRTWTPSNQGMAETAPTHILLDPTTPVGKRGLWVAAMGRGVYKSSDDGATWTLKNNGIVQHDPLAWRLARAADGTLYVVIVRRSEDGSISTAGDGALYKSTDGAESWTGVNLPSGTNGPYGLAIDPHDTQRLYLAEWCRAAGMDGQGGGIFLSTNGGRTWKTVFDHDQHVYDVTIDPRDSNVLYAASFESSVWRSNDRGEHWTRIPGFNFKRDHRVMPDPIHPNMIYVSTFGAGVLYGPSSGAGGHADIATPVMQPGR